MAKGRHYHTQSKYPDTGSKLKFSTYRDDIGRQEILNRLEVTLKSIEPKLGTLIKERLLVSGFIRNDLENYKLVLFPYGEPKKMETQEIPLLRKESNFIHLLREALKEKNSQGYRIKLLEPPVLRLINQQNP